MEKNTGVVWFSRELRGVAFEFPEEILIDDVRCKTYVSRRCLGKIKNIEFNLSHRKAYCSLSLDGNYPAPRGRCVLKRAYFGRGGSRLCIVLQEEGSLRRIYDVGVSIKLETLEPHRDAIDFLVPRAKREAILLR